MFIRNLSSFSGIGYQNLERPLGNTGNQQATFDIGRLFDHVDDLTITSQVFRKMVPIELGYRGMLN